jgi:hypothetical protein
VVFIPKGRRKLLYGEFATVADAVKDVDGRTVTVSYHGKEKKIAIPDGTPVVTFAPATKGCLIVHCVDRSSEPSRVIILRRRSSGKGTAVFVLLTYQMHVA